MVVGHAALALIVGARRQRPPLWLLIGAAYAADGIEVVLRFIRIPDPAQSLSHGVALLLPMALLLAAAYWLVYRDRAGALILVAMVLSHIPADYLTGFVKPTWPGGPRIGLALYERGAWDYCMEATLIVLGMTLWAKRDPMRAIRRARWVAITAVLLTTQLFFSLHFSGHTTPASWADVFVRWIPGI